MQHHPTPPTNPYSTTPNFSGTPPAFSPPPNSHLSTSHPLTHSPAPAPPPPPSTTITRHHRAPSTIAARTALGAGGGSTLGGGGGGGGGLGNAMDDPVVEARKTLALLLGVGGGEGLLSRLEKEVEGVFGGVEGAFVEEGGGEGVELTQLRETISRLLTTLQSSPLGGFPLPTENHPLPTLPQRIETSSQVVQRLFRERQRLKEGSDIAGSVLGSN